MASVRSIKKDIDYLFEEVIADSYLTAYFHPEKKDKVLEFMEQAVAKRNELIARAANSVEKNNPSLVKRHYAQLRRDLMSSVDGLFEQLSALNK